MKTSTKLTTAFAAILCTTSSLSAQRYIPVDAYTTKPELFVAYRQSNALGTDNHTLVYENGRVVARSGIPGSDTYTIATTWLSGSEVGALQEAITAMFSRRLVSDTVCPASLDTTMHEIAGYVGGRWNAHRTCDPNAGQAVMFSWMTILHQQATAGGSSNGQSQTIKALEDGQSGITVLDENSVQLWNQPDSPSDAPIAQGSLTSLTGSDRGVTVFESGRVELWEDSSDNVVEFFDMNPTDTQNFKTLSEQAAQQLAGAQSDQYEEDHKPIMVIDYSDSSEPGNLQNLAAYHIVDYSPSQFGKGQKGMAGADGSSTQPRPIQQQIYFTLPADNTPGSQTPTGLDGSGSSADDSSTVPPRDLFDTVQVFDENHRAIMVLDDDCNTAGPAGDVFQLILGLLCP